MNEDRKPGVLQRLKTAVRKVFKRPAPEPKTLDDTVKRKDAMPEAMRQHAPERGPLELPTRQIGEVEHVFFTQQPADPSGVTLHREEVDQVQWSLDWFMTTAVADRAAFESFLMDNWSSFQGSAITDTIFRTKLIRSKLTDFFRDHPQMHFVLPNEYNGIKVIHWGIAKEEDRTAFIEMFREKHWLIRGFTPIEADDFSFNQPDAQKQLDAFLGEHYLTTAVHPETLASFQAAAALDLNASPEPFTGNPYIVDPKSPVGQVLARQSGKARVQDAVDDVIERLGGIVPDEAGHASRVTPMTEKPVKFRQQGQPRNTRKKSKKPGKK
jgi:hypothetical protein